MDAALRDQAMRGEGVAWCTAYSGIISGKCRLRVSSSPVSFSLGVMTTPASSSTTSVSPTFMTADDVEQHLRHLISHLKPVQERYASGPGTTTVYDSTLCDVADHLPALLDPPSQGGKARHGERVFQREWTSGGRTGGSCYTDSSTVEYEAITPDQVPDFTDLNAVLLTVVPDFPYLSYLALMRHTETSSETERSYYGNYYETTKEFIAVSRVLSSIADYCNRTQRSLAPLPVLPVVLPPRAARKRASKPPAAPSAVKGSVKR